MGGGAGLVNPGNAGTVHGVDVAEPGGHKATPAQLRYVGFESKVVPVLGEDGDKAVA